MFKIFLKNIQEATIKKQISNIDKNFNIHKTNNYSKTDYKQILTNNFLREQNNFVPDNKILVNNFMQTFQLHSIHS